MKLNEKILYYRKRAKLSQEELAAVVGVSRQAVSKWELGDAVPEVDKLLALARAFGVTTDELLSESDPPQPEPEPEPQPEGASASALDRLPGFLRRLARRYGWLAGVYIALSGLGVALVGALARFMFGGMFRAADGFHITIEGAESLPPEAVDQIVDGLGGVSGPGAMLSGPEGLFATVATVIIVVGAAVMIAGIVLAVWLYRRGRNTD